MNKTSDFLETWTTEALVSGIIEEDKKVAEAVEKAKQQIIALANVVHEKLENDGRLFYIGAGTSGRLGILDASECPPTFGVSPDMVVGIIAGGDKAIRKSVEGAEDDTVRGWRDLSMYLVGRKDIVVGIAASGTTPYVLAALQMCNASGIITGCIVCKKDTPIARVAKYPVEVEVGEEFIRGSTRMKAGTAQKMVLNNISTTVMIKLGRVMGRSMVDMLRKLNAKLEARAVCMVAVETGLSLHDAWTLLEKHGGVREAIEAHKSR